MCTALRAVILKVVDLTERSLLGRSAFMASYAISAACRVSVRVETALYEMHLNHVHNHDSLAVRNHLLVLL